MSTFDVFGLFLDDDDDDEKGRRIHRWGRFFLQKRFATLTRSFVRSFVSLQTSLSLCLHARTRRETLRIFHVEHLDLDDNFAPGRNLAFALVRVAEIRRRFDNSATANFHAF